MNIFSQLNLPIPSKTTIILSSALIVSIFINTLLYKRLKDKSEIINSKNVEISVQNKTISTLQTKTSESIKKIESMNDTLNNLETDYQTEINKLLKQIGTCTSNEPSSELESKAQKDFQEIIDNLAKSTKKEN